MKNISCKELFMKTNCIYDRTLVSDIHILPSPAPTQPSRPKGKPCVVGFVTMVTVCLLSVTRYMQYNIFLVTTGVDKFDTNLIVNSLVYWTKGDN